MHTHHPLLPKLCLPPPHPPAALPLPACLLPLPPAGKPKGAVAAAIESDLGGYDKFVADFKAAGATQFGSGWAWLSVNSAGKLEISKTPNAENPWVHGATPILTMDVW